MKTTIRANLRSREGARIVGTTKISKLSWRGTNDLISATEIRCQVLKASSRLCITGMSSTLRNLFKWLRIAGGIILSPIILSLIKTRMTKRHPLNLQQSKRGLQATIRIRHLMPINCLSKPSRKYLTPSIGFTVCKKIKTKMRMGRQETKMRNFLLSMTLTLST